MVSQAADLLNCGRIARNDHSAVSEGTQILARIEAETRNVAVTSDVLAAGLTNVSLGCVLDYQQTICLPCVNYIEWHDVAI
jgi:hypothetical protein